MSALSWAVGEEIEFPFRAGGVITGTAGAPFYRTTYVRGALTLPGNLPIGTGVLANGQPLASPVTTVWLSCQWYRFEAGRTAYATPQVGLANSAVTLGGIFVGTKSDAFAKLTLYKVDSAGAITQLATETGVTLSDNALHRIDMAITAFNTASANVKIYLDGNATATIDWTGSLTGLGFTTLDCFRALSNAVIGVNSFVSEIIIADEDTRTYVAVATLAPDGAGTTNQWTGTYADIDEAVLNDADMITSAAAGQIFECTLNDLPAGNWSVRGVKIAARASKGASGPGTLKLGIDSAGTDSTVDRALTTSLANYERLMELNPITGVRFTVAEVNALQAALISAT